MPWNGLSTGCRHLMPITAKQVRFGDQTGHSVSKMGFSLDLDFRPDFLMLVAINGFFSSAPTGVCPYRQETISYHYQR